METSNNELCENIQYMKLLHELKMAFPSIPDDFVKQVVLKHGKEKTQCVEILEQERERRFTLQALLSHQMEQKLKMEQELQAEMENLNIMRHSVAELKRRCDLTLLKKTENNNKAIKNNNPKSSKSIIEATSALKKDIAKLERSCNEMSEEVTQSTEEDVPLGETSIGFYEDLLLKSVEEPSPCQRNALNPSLQISEGKANSSGSISTGSVGEGPQWACSECTFLNHPALDRCEECEMPRITVGVQSGSIVQMRSTSVTSETVTTSYNSVVTNYNRATTPAASPSTNNCQAIDFAPNANTQINQKDSTGNSSSNTSIIAQPSSSRKSEPM